MILSHCLTLHKYCPLWHGRSNREIANAVQLPALLVRFAIHEHPTATHRVEAEERSAKERLKRFRFGCFHVLRNCKAKRVLIARPHETVLCNRSSCWQATVWQSRGFWL
jgi:hypothetical protein